MSESVVNDPFFNDLEASACYGDGAINPSQIPVPRVDADELEALGQDIKMAGSGIAESGTDIVASWGGLSGIYTAPESETLLAAVNPVGTKGDEIEPAATTTGDALITFAERVRELKPRLSGLRADSVELRTRINADEDWREDEDLFEEHETLLGEVNTAVAEYQEAERECANAITALYGGPTFLAVDELGGREPGANEIPYGFEEVTEGMAMPWGTPQEFDHPWYVDAWDGVADLATGFVQDLGGVTGAWHDGQWGVPIFGEQGRSNFMAYMEENLEGLSLLTGFYDPTKPEGEQWGVESVDEWWGNFKPVAWEVGQGIVPTDEWDDRPGYVITQGVINVGSIVGGVVLSATGIGATVGVPLILSRLQSGFRAINGLGSDLPSIPDNIDFGSSRRPDLSGIDIGGSSSPDGVPTPDTDGMMPSQSTFDGMNESLESLNSHNNSPSETPSSPESHGDAPEQAGADTTDGSRGDSDTSDSSGSPETTDSTDSTDSSGTADTTGTRESADSTGQGQDRAGDRDEVDTQATPAEVERMIREAEEFNAEHAGDLDVQAQVYGSRWDSEGTLDDSRVEEMAAVHNGDGPSAVTDRTVTNSTGGSGGGPVDTPSGGSGDIRVDGSPNSGGGVATVHGGTGSGSLGGSSDLNGSGRGDSPQPTLGDGSDPRDTSSTERAPDGPPEVHRTEKIKPNDDLFHNGEKRFADGLEDKLTPNTRYDLLDANSEVATVVHTDADGRISYIKTSPGPEGTGNPELVNPRPNATYIIDDFTYKTDHLGRTVSVEGELRRGARGRNDEQTLIGYDGQDYYRQATKNPEVAFANHPDRDAILEDFEGFADVRYNGSHIIGGGEYAGAGERINVIPLMETINQNRVVTPTIRSNFRRLELAWKYLIDGEWNRLMGISRQQEGWEAQVSDWQDMIDAADGDAKIYVKFDIEYDNDMNPVDYDPRDHNEKNPKRPERQINPPPTFLNVSWSLNGVSQEPLSYRNTPN